MTKEERIELIERFYAGDVTLYFYDQIKEYSRVITNRDSNLECFRNCVEKTIEDVEEILEDE